MRDEKEQDEIEWRDAEEQRGEKPVHHGLCGCALQVYLSNWQNMVVGDMENKIKKRMGNDIEKHWRCWGEHREYYIYSIFFCREMGAGRRYSWGQQRILAKAGGAGRQLFLVWITVCVN